MISVEEAFQSVESRVRPLCAERVDLGRAVGRVIAETIRADVSSPPHNKSVMDGFAVRSQDVLSGVKQFDVLETIVAGSLPTQSLPPGSASRIMTGAPLPVGADAVVMIEMSNLEYNAPTPAQVILEVDEQFSAGKHIMPTASNFAQGDEIFQVGHTVRPVDIGLLAEIGAASVPVIREPQIAILPTGDELVDCSQKPGPAQIRNSNGPMIQSLCLQHTSNVEDLGIGVDRRDELQAKMERGLQGDVLILSGGVSAGTMDLVPEVLQSLAVEAIFHKVKVKPGKPIFFGVKHQPDGGCCFVFGLPGNPVSSLVGMQLFVATALRKMAGKPDCRPTSFPAVLVKAHQTRGDRPTYWPARESTASKAIESGNKNSHRQVEPLPWNGSSDLLSLRDAEGLILFPPRRSAYEAGEIVDYLPLDSVSPN